MAITKYQNREGYSHRDILRLAHPSTKDPLLCFLFDYITHGLAKATENLSKPKPETSEENTVSQASSAATATNVDGDEESEAGAKVLTVEELKEFIEVVEKMKQSTDETALVAAIRQHNLVREHMPSAMLNSSTIWSALLEKMPLTAMIRNLGKQHWSADLFIR